MMRIDSQPRMFTIRAIQRKLLLLIYTLFKNNESYDENHHIKLKEKLEKEKNAEPKENLIAIET